VGAGGERVVAPRLGLPKLPVVAWPYLSPAEEDRDERLGLHWKTRTLIEWAAGRPFAWVDDEVTAMDRAWVLAHHPGSALLHRVDPRRGLAEGDFKVLGEWLLNAHGHAPFKARQVRSLG
jgi:hypothetical protein